MEPPTRIALPVEISWLIRDFLPLGDISNSYGFNRVFLDLAFNARYRKVKLLDVNVRRFFWVATRVCDPFIAPRVHLLRVDPQQIARNIERLGELADTRLGKHPVIKEFVTSKMNTRSGQAFITVVFSRLSELDSFHLDWAYTQEEVSQYDENVVLPLLKAMCSSLPLCLKSLGLMAPLPILLATLGSIPRFDQLRKLSVEFWGLRWPKPTFFRQAVVRPMTNLRTRLGWHYPSALAPFISAHAQSLEVLSIWTLKCNLSSLFCDLAYLPQLKIFNLHSLLSQQTLSDPTGFNAFFHRQPALKHLTLGYPTKQLPGFTFPESLIPSPAWAAQCLQGVNLENLETLHINGPIIHYLEPLGPLFGSACTKLRVLKFGDSTLRLLAIEDFLAHLSTGNSLKTLFIFVNQLTPALLDSLYAKFPALEVLNLRCLLISNVEDLTRESVRRFCNAMEGRRYPRWRISELRIWRDGPLGERVTRKCAEAVVKCLPRNVLCLAGPPPGSQLQRIY